MPITASRKASMLFVYGTLMRGTRGAMAKKLHSQSDYIGSGWINARLYSLGRYPGVILSESPSDQVHGEVVCLSNPGYSLRWIDAYEGCGQCDPEPQEYERVMVPVSLSGGGALEAWVYVYKRSVSRARCIRNGRFQPFSSLGRIKRSCW